jgi:hypothetical protein
MLEIVIALYLFDLIMLPISLMLFCSVCFQVGDNNPTIGTICTLQILVNILLKLDREQ